MKICKKCGKQLNDADKFCSYCSEPISENEVETIGDIRCIKCGNVIKKSENFCTECRQPILSNKEYDSINNKKKILDKVNFTYSTFHILSRVLLYSCLILLFIIIILAAINDPKNVVINNIAMSVIIFDFIILPIFLILLIIRIILGRKTKLKYIDYKGLREEMKKIPKTFFAPIEIVKVKEEKENSNENIKTLNKEEKNKGNEDFLPNGKKIYTKKEIIKQRAFAILGLIGTILALTYVINLAKMQFNNSNTKNNNVIKDQVINNTNVSSNKKLSGRWESSNGQTAICFSGSTAYFGNKYNSNSDIIAECKSWNKGIATYTISNNKITFKYKTGSYSYKYDGKTIYFDGEKISKSN